MPIIRNSPDKPPTGEPQDTPVWGSLPHWDRYKEVDSHRIRSTRDILEVENLRWKYALIRKALFENQWKILWKNLEKRGSFWSWSKKVSMHSTKTIKAVYEVSSTGISSDRGITIDHWKWYQTIPDEDLPLLLTNKKIPEQAKGIVEDRLKGTQEGLPHDQNLADEYEKIQERFSRINMIIWICEKVMNVYVTRAYSYLWKDHESHLITQIFNGRTYVYDVAPRKDFGLIQVPEKPPITGIVPSKILRSFL